jgi:ABC-type multidrug transport system ATPase subunit
VSKTYSGVQALKEVSFSMNKGEVFVLLGHNGAGDVTHPSLSLLFLSSSSAALIGKSTLINIITGVTKPTHGKVYLNGYDIEEDIAEIQQTIGVCSQDDYLWDELTAKEHMLLTAIFKGIKWGPELHAAVDNVLDLVQLSDRSSEFCRQYSGGMKRRLSVAMSTVGDVEILFLDEPTTGLDPVSRRRVWEAINIMKQNRVVVLTTHNMEEADYLADTIMIMHSGHVRAFGDPLFLKQTFGKGYQVNIQIAKAEDYQETSELIMNLLPDATCLYDENSLGMSVTVPKINLIGLPRLFTWLESSRRAQLMIKEWGVSNTTLEQVFLLLCAQNTEINMGMTPQTSAPGGSGSGAAGQQRSETLCPMCNIRPREHVLVRNMNQETIVLPNSICWDCSLNNPHFKLQSSNLLVSGGGDGEEVKDGQGGGGGGVEKSLSEDDHLNEQSLIEHLIKEENNQQRQAELQKLIQKAQAASERHLAEQFLLAEREKERRLEEEEGNQFDESKWNEEATRLLENSGEAVAATGSPSAPSEGIGAESQMLPSGGVTKRGREGGGDLESGSQASHPTTAKKDAWGGSTWSQMHAIMVKNTVLQSRQRCSNICRFVRFYFSFLVCLAHPVLSLPLSV